MPERDPKILPIKNDSWRRSGITINVRGITATGKIIYYQKGFGVKKFLMEPGEFAAWTWGAEIVRRGDA